CHRTRSTTAWICTSWCSSLVPRRCSTRSSCSLPRNTARRSTPGAQRLLVDLLALFPEALHARGITAALLVANHVLHATRVLIAARKRRVARLGLCRARHRLSLRR